MINILVNIILKIFFALLFFMITSCSTNRLEDIGLIKKKDSEYATFRNPPLEMPPDMYLTPPKEEEAINRGIIENISVNKDISLDDILLGKKQNKLQGKKNLKKANKNTILKKILNTKAVVILK